MSSVKVTARNIGLALAFAGAILAFGPAAGRETRPASVAAPVGATGRSPLLLESQPSPAGYSCFLQNSCPPCKGKPVARSQKKEPHENCQCHRVTYQCDDGTTKTCFDNCE